MNIIQKIIIFFKNLFHRFFGKKKITKKVQKNIVHAKNKKYLKGYGILANEALSGFLPLYMVINDDEKKELLKKVNLVKSKLLENNESIDNNILKELAKISKKIEEKKISFYQSEIIDDKLNDLLGDKDLANDSFQKIEKLNKEIMDVIGNYDKNLKDKVIHEYKKINYITIANIVLDDMIIKIQELNNNYKKHKFNKLYYEREIGRIKRRLNDLKSLRNNVKIREEIEKLRKDLFIKSKDKYDLLYNDEIFVNLNKICDNLYNKVNKRIIDLKKEQTVKEEKTKKVECEKKDDNELLEWQERIIKRFEDIELARKILLLRQKQRENDFEKDNLIEYVNKIYFDFINGEKIVFNYERNKSKTELVKLYNDINYISTRITKKDNLFINHINYQMEDLITTTKAKKIELDQLLEKECNIRMKENENSILVNNKLNLLMANEEKRIVDAEKIKVKIKKDDN